MKKVEIQICRFDPELDDSPRLESYRVPCGQGNTALGALIYIYENLDPTLAFRYGCRFKACGTCAVEVDGKPRLSCTTHLKEGLTIKPLSKLPLIRDLVIDQEPVQEKLLTYDPYVVRKHPLKEEPEKFMLPEEMIHLARCRDCLACLANCPNYRPEGNFAGPYIFVQLARLHYDPRDSIDRLEQLRKAGIEECLECNTCPCLYGIKIKQYAIDPFLS
jgi:succinate dehydrogenase/fumarate reductase iron-sulfur protein